MRKPWKVRGLGWRKTLKCDLSQGAASIQLEGRAVRLMPPQRGGALIAASMARIPVARNDPVLEQLGVKKRCLHPCDKVRCIWPVDRHSPDLGGRNVILPRAPVDP